MKVYFDTNMYVAEALLGEAAERLIEATLQGRWRVYTTGYVLEELNRVLTEKMGFSRRLAILSRCRIMRRSVLIEPGESRHVVPHDPKDSPILRAALEVGADYLVTAVSRRTGAMGMTRLPRHDSRERLSLRPRV